MHEKSLEEEKTSSLRWHLQNGRAGEEIRLLTKRGAGVAQMSLVDRVVDYVTEEENEKLEVRQRKGRRAGGGKHTGGTRNAGNARGTRMHSNPLIRLPDNGSIWSMVQVWASAYSIKFAG